MTDPTPPTTADLSPEALDAAEALALNINGGTRIADAITALRARLKEAERDRDGWEAQAQATAREARACFYAQSEIDEAWDQIGTRGNRAHLSLPEQLAVLLRDHDAAEARADRAEAAVERRAAEAARLRRLMDGCGCWTK
jgi:hypothetical protein